MSRTPPSRPLLPSEPTTGPHIGMIWAQARNGVIGAAGTMPWHVPEDMARFRNLTHGSPVIMGRKTWDSLPERFRPLPGRTNIVITRDDATSRELAEESAVPASSLEEAVELAKARAESAHRVWIMGGGAIYAEAVEKEIAGLASVTRFDLEVDGDTYAPVLEPQQWELAAAEPASGWSISESGIGYRFETYQRI
ncbi:dihydrofolate reductase [Nesterenkonia muleiensis]|uniref:dihydrofolate reductase n=1 Tax=Nesterenkonia muleiensis TaxID=2282648 RepID=UPI000E73C82B|nr:dihydrofolate reductase [Nesterenkonia muleiensis]